MRKFSVIIGEDAAKHMRHITTDKAYPVLMCSGPEDDEILIVNDIGELMWIDFDDCTACDVEA